jgi:tRNA pseudouridine32 synthase/23S rRNA pseudouridine746 synthase
MADEALGGARRRGRSRRGSSGRRSRRTRPDSPLPDRDGIPAVRLHMPAGAPFDTVAAFLLDKTHGAAEVERRLDAGEVVLTDGTVVTRQTPYAAGGWAFLYRDVLPEATVPGELTVLYRDENIVVVDKPHFLATMPRGSHVAQTVVVRLRRELGLPELTAAHRLDRLTAGVLLATVRREVRAAYQEMFARREARKTYYALAPLGGLPLPTEVHSRIVKERGTLQVREVPGEINAITRVELDATLGANLGRYRLTPLTGRTHQLRVHMAGLGIPILGDPLYPTIREARPDDFDDPLQLLAHTLAFTDPLTGEDRCFTSRRTLSGHVGGPR